MKILSFMIKNLIGKFIKEYNYEKYKAILFWIWSSCKKFVAKLNSNKIDLDLSVTTRQKTKRIKEQNFSFHSFNFDNDQFDTSLEKN